MATEAEIKYALKRPRIFPGYIYWVTGVLNAFVGYGTYMYAWGVFVPYLRREFRYSNAEIGLTITIQNLEGRVQAPPVGYILDTAGPKWVCCAFLFLGGVGYVLLGWYPIRDVWWLWFSRGILIAAMGQAALYTSSAKLETWYFIKNRGRMMALKTIGAALGGLALVPFTEFFAAGAGWRVAAYASALLLFALVPYNYFFLSNKPPQAYGLLPDNEKLPHERTKEELEAMRARGHTKVMTADDFLPSLGLRDALKTRAFWCLVAAGAFGAFTGFGIQTWFVAHLRVEGYTSGEAAFYYAVFFPATILGRIVAAIWADKVSPKWFLAYSNFGQALPLIILSQMAKNPIVIWVWVLWFGSSFGMSPALGTHLRASWFGRKWYATIGGLTSIITIGFAAVGPLVVGWVADLTGTYRLSFLFIAAAYILSGLAYVPARPPKPMREARLKAREAGIKIV